MLCEPDSSLSGVRHAGTSLNLDETRGVVEVEGKAAHYACRGGVSSETELEELVHHESRGVSSVNLRDCQIDHYALDSKRVIAGDGGQCRLCNSCIETCRALHIHIMAIAIDHTLNIIFTLSISNYVTHVRK